MFFMPRVSGKYKVKLNSSANIEELLQETYNQACQQINLIQDEMNKLANSTVLSSEITDVRVKYAKAMNDFIVNKDKAIGRKLEIAKFLGEVMKYNGDVNKTVSENDDTFSNSSLNWDEIKNMVNSDTNKIEEYRAK